MRCRKLISPTTINLTITGTHSLYSYHRYWNNELVFQNVDIYHHNESVVAFYTERMSMPHTPQTRKCQAKANISKRIGSWVNNWLSLFSLVPFYLCNWFLQKKSVYPLFFELRKSTFYADVHTFVLIKKQHFCIWLYQWEALLLLHDSQDASAVEQCFCFWFEVIVTRG